MSESETPAQFAARLAKESQGPDEPVATAFSDDLYMALRELGGKPRWAVDMEGKQADGSRWTVRLVLADKKA